MDAQAVVAVSAVVVTLCQVIKATGLSGRWSMLFALLISGLGVGAWAYTEQNFTRETTWDYVAGWAACFTSATGVFGLVNTAPDRVMDVKDVGARLMQAVKGTGDGKG